MNYKGIYINLDRSTERRAALDDNLALYNLKQRYKRLRAADGNEEKISSSLQNANEIGCFLSHVWALREGLNSGHHVHIIEDDTIFASATERTLEWAITSGIIDNYDLLYTDITLPLSNDTYRKFKTLFDRAVTRDDSGAIKNVKFQALDLRDIPFAAASSYLVNKNSAQKLRRIYDDEMGAGIRSPIDAFFRTQAQSGALKVGCLFPFITSVKVEETLTSTVYTSPDSTKKLLAANIGRYSFFVGCDWDECDMFINTHLTQPTETDRHAQALTKLLAFSLMDDIPR